MPKAKALTKAIRLDVRVGLLIAAVMFGFAFWDFSVYELDFHPTEYFNGGLMWVTAWFAIIFYVIVAFLLVRLSAPKIL